MDVHVYMCVCGCGCMCVYKCAVKTTELQLDTHGPSSNIIRLN